MILLLDDCRWSHQITISIKKLIGILTKFRKIWLFHLALRVLLIQYRITVAVHDRLGFFGLMSNAIVDLHQHPRSILSDVGGSSRMIRDLLL